MNNKTQPKKKSKYNKLKVSPLIPIIAVIEIALLICVCTYAWFAVSSNKTVYSDLIKVNPDSGLEIDFADTDDGKININDYIHNFTFEPATSLDGRNIYFPTTGTFNSTTTTDMKFREGTINDINSKYINIDFSLTNTGDEPIPVYLSSKSSFKVTDQEGNKKNSSALRFAFYKNDGEPGKTGGPFTIYFNNTFPNSNQPYIYLWTKDSEGNTDKNAEWPGVPMVRYSDNLYSYTFDNDEYANLIISDGDTSTSTVAHQTVDIPCYTIDNGSIFNLSGTTTKDNKKLYNFTTTPSEITPPSGYAVIAPGTSTGFKRSYEPVLTINDDTGSPTSITPAYAGAFDDYLYKEAEEGAEDTSMFTIEPNQKVSLSLVIWLEGTDKGCIAEDYANLKIDLDFLFATEKAGADNLFTYKFYDKTLETWVRNTGVSKTGNTVKPVVMMYDNNDEKGYLMYNNPQDPTEWSCNAPDYISTHNITFRRVNPADETDVWNWWEAGSCAVMEQGTKFVSADSKYVSSSGDTVLMNKSFADGHLIGATVNFTAFGDSGPYATAENSNVWTQSNLHSCGGAWGKHDTTEFVVCDGTSNTWFDDSNGVITIRLNLEGQEIEYKGSPFRHTVYRFTLPNVVASTSGGFNQFNIGRYYNYMDNLSALEDKNDNPNLKYHKLVVSNMTYQSQYFQVVDNFNGEQWEYFGHEIYYLQVNKGDQYNNNMPYYQGAVFRIHFKDNSSSGDMYVQCRRDSGVDYTEGSENYSWCDTYPRVVPFKSCDYTVKRMNPDNPDYDEWNSTKNYTFNRESRVQQINTANCQGVNTFGRDMWPISSTNIRVYFSNTHDWSGLKAYYWNGGQSWPGNVMKHAKDSYGHGVYYIDIPDNTSGIIFTNDGNSQTVDITPDSQDINSKLENGYGYYIDEDKKDDKGHYKVIRYRYS